MDQSISRSLIDNGTTGTRSQLIQGKFSSIDVLFPFFDQMVQLTKIPTYLTSLFSIFYLFQSLLTALWPMSNSRVSNKENINVISMFSLIFWFIDTKPSPSHFVSLFIVVICLSFFIYFWLIGIIIFYKKYLRFFTWGLYVSRFFLECLVPIMIFPNTAAFGSAVYLLLDTKERKYWAFGVVSLITLILNITILFFSYQIFSKSCCISFSFISTFNAAFSVLLFAVNSVSILLPYIFYFFPLYTIIVFQVFHIILMGFVLNTLFVYLPYHKRVTNIMHSVIISTEIMSTVVFMIMFIINKEDIMIYGLMAVFCVFVLFIVLSIIFFNQRYNKIIGQLTKIENADESDLITEDDYASYYTNLGFLSSKYIAITYLHVGFTEMCPLFLNWSLTKFIMHKISSVYAISNVLQIVSFFPSESHQLNILFSVITTKSDLKFDLRFLIYQTYRIKSLRQSSSSSDVNERISKLRSLTKQCFADVISFWKVREPSLSIFESFAKEKHRINSLWIEAIRDYPNSAKLCDEYTTFLIECMSDFHSAITMKQRADMIESGANIAIDASFRSLMWCYPLYYRRGILDQHGNLLDPSQWKTSSQSSYSFELSTGASEVVETESTIEYVEKVGRIILNKAKLRFACDNALKRRTHPSYSCLPLLSIIAFLTSFAVFVYLFFYIKSAMFSRKDSVNYIYNLGLAHFHVRIASFIVMNQFSIYNRRVGDLTTVINAIKSDGYPPHYINFFTDYLTSTLTQSFISRTYFSNMVEKINELIYSSSYDIYPLVFHLIDPSVPFNQCHNGTILKSSYSNVQNVLSYHYFLVSYLTSLPKHIDYYNDDNFCEFLLNQMSFIEKIDHVYIGYLDFSNQKNQELLEVNKLYLIIFPVLLFIATFIPYMVSSIVYIRHVTRITDILISLEKPVKDESMDPIRIDVLFDIIPTSEPRTRITNIVPIVILLFICSLFDSILSYGMIYYASTFCEMVNKLNYWTYYSAVRLSTSADFLTQCYHIIFLNSTTKSYFITREKTLVKAKESLSSLLSANRVLLRGDELYPSIYSYDHLLDKYNYAESCSQGNNESADFHDSYRCSSVDKLVSSINDMAHPILTDPESYDGKIGDPSILHLLHILNSHLWLPFEQTLERLDNLSISNYNYLIELCIIFLVCGIIASVLVFSGGFVLRYSESQSYRTLLSIIKRIPPNSIINDKQLKNFLLNKDEEENMVTSISRNVLHSSSDAMLCVSLSGVVEMVNPAVTSTLGFTPEQVLGQPITSVFSEEDGEKIIGEMNIILEGQSGCVYEDRMQCVTDDSTLLPVATTLLGMGQLEDGGMVTSFVIILKNESKLLKKQKDAEEAKVKSENLLYHILPQEIVMRLNRNEKDICFTVPSATIIFIDVVKFSEYTKDLTPQEIMGTLSHMFSSFDHMANSYSLLLKIKLIGDIYMAAAGLFSGGESQEEHANQTVKFALEVLNSFDDVNIKLDANLQVRIGVNTGGPIIAGVLGTDKPVFDIIGDTINVASRLQTTDIPGKIQVSQSTYNLLTKNEYSIEERGEIFLKGKGQFKTYLISPDIITTTHMENQT